MKFGGTSVRDAQRVRCAVSIVAARSTEPVVVVVSAAAGVTRWLLDLGAASADMKDNAAGEFFGALQDRQFSILDELGLDPAAYQSARQRLDRLFEELATLIDAIEADGNYDARRQDAVISFGERFSSALFHAAAQSMFSSEHVDAARVMVTDERFRAARPDTARIGELAGAVVAPLLDRGVVVVTEGFVGATPAGDPTTMGVRGFRSLGIASGSCPWGPGGAHLDGCARNVDCRASGGPSAPGCCATDLRRSRRTRAVRSQGPSPGQRRACP